MKLSCISPASTGIVFFSLVHPNFAAAVLNLWKNASPALPGINASSVDVRPDSRLDIKRVYTGDEIIKNDCLVVGLWLMGQLGSKEWSCKIPAAQGPYLPNFPGVIIDIDPQEPFPNIPLRFAIWGLKKAMLDLLARDQFVESIYELYWDYLTIGTIYIQPIQNSQASTPRQSLDGKRSNRSLTVPFALDLGVDIAIQEIPGAQPIDPRDIWITMFESQERLGYPEAHLIPKAVFQLGPFLPSSKAFFTIDPLHGPDLPRIYPPFLHVSTVDYALLLLAVWMCQHNHFSDFGFTISVSGTLVGAGRLGAIRTQGLPLPTGGLPGNILTY